VNASTAAPVVEGGWETYLVDSRREAFWKRILLRRGEHGLKRN